jgi:lipopolysaccharide export system permease protein
MLQNKIFQNFFKEIIRTFLIIVLGLSLIALTVRAVSFLKLVVDNGYSLYTYFQYSILNLFGIAPKFIPLAFLVAITIFILRHIDDSEFIILWSSGVKKIQIVNLFLFTSAVVLIFYLILSVFLTPIALNKSRQLLSQDKFNSFLPTVRAQQFSDSFKGFTFIVGKKIENNIQKIFLHDTGNNLKKLSANVSNVSSTVIVALNGTIDKRRMILFDGQIISSKNNFEENEIIKFEQLNIDLSDLATTTIKQPKLQETSTLKLINCFVSSKVNSKICKEDAKKEILPILMRRIILPFYIPVVTLICSILLLRNQKLNINKIFVFICSFVVLILTELIIRYTGLNNTLRLIYIIAPFSFLTIFYLVLIYKFSKESKTT